MNRTEGLQRVLVSAVALSGNAPTARVHTDRVFVPNDHCSDLRVL